LDVVTRMYVLAEVLMDSFGTSYLDAWVISSDAKRPCRVGALLCSSRR